MGDALSKTATNRGWPEAAPVHPPLRARLRAEVWIVLGLTFGQSGVYALLSLINKATNEGGLSASSATLNQTVSAKPWFDAIVQITGIAFDLVPVALVIWLLGARAAKAASGSGMAQGARLLGLDQLRRPRTLVRGLGLAAVIGIPGLALYAAGRALGITVNVVPSGLDGSWWNLIVLLGSAAAAALSEETVVAGWLVIRLRQLAWGWPAVFAATALLRGSYHLYQGIGSFVGNVVMGLVFVWFARRWGGVAALIIGHFTIDAVAFVGWQLAGGWLTSSGLLG